jgi:hypothetical protein
MNFPTNIKDAADYLQKAYVDRAELRGGDLAALRMSAEGVRPLLLRLARNAGWCGGCCGWIPSDRLKPIDCALPGNYQWDVVNGAVSAIIDYLKPRKVGKRDARQTVMVALHKLRNAPAFGPKGDAP